MAWTAGLAAVFFIVWGCWIALRWTAPRILPTVRWFLRLIGRGAVGTASVISDGIDSAAERNQSYLQQLIRPRDLESWAVSISYVLFFILLGSLIFASVAHAAPRSHTAVAEFKRLQPCPATGQARGPCPGWVVDHVQPLCAGGPDTSSNMQWQRAADAKAKDRGEVRQCRELRRAVLP